MGWIGAKAAGRLAGLSVLVALAGFGCAIQPVLDPVDPESVSAEPEPAADPVATMPSPLPSPSPQASPIAVVIDDARNSNLELLQVFSAKLGRPYEILNLAHRSPAAVRVRLASLAPCDVVVVGPMALAAAADLPGITLVHSGVLTPGTSGRGIDALPPFDAQLDYWLRLTPQMKTLGVIGGKGMASRMAALKAASAARGVQLEQRLVSSDKETLLAFRSMVPHIDGFIFLPDEAVLSPPVIQQVMNHGKRNAVQILVYSPVMFNLGATLYLQPDPVQVAQALIELLDNPDENRTVQGMRVKSRLHENLRLSATSTDAVYDG